MEWLYSATGSVRPAVEQPLAGAVFDSDGVKCADNLQKIGEPQPLRAWREAARCGRCLLCRLRARRALCDRGEQFGAFREHGVVG